jgi:hypothetical protein
MTYPSPKAAGYWHGGRLLASKEDSAPIQIDPDTLDRLMFLKFRYRLGYESLCAEVGDSGGSTA